MFYKTARLSAAALMMLAIVAPGAWAQNRYLGESGISQNKAVIIGGGAAAGAVLGGLLGGGKGAAAGAIAGGAGGAIYDHARNDGGYPYRTGRDTAVIIGGSAGAGAAAGGIAGGKRGALIGAGIGAASGYVIHRTTQNQDNYYRHR
jgi:hypothetical protein